MSWATSIRPFGSVFASPTRRRIVASFDEKHPKQVSAYGTQFWASSLVLQFQQTRDWRPERLSAVPPGLNLERAILKQTLRPGHCWRKRPRGFGLQAILNAAAQGKFRQKKLKYSLQGVEARGCCVFSWPVLPTTSPCA